MYALRICYNDSNSDILNNIHKAIVQKETAFTKNPKPFNSYIETVPILKKKLKQEISGNFKSRFSRIERFVKKAKVNIFCMLCSALKYLRLEIRAVLHRRGGGRLIKLIGKPNQCIKNPHILYMVLHCTRWYPLCLIAQRSHYRVLSCTRFEHLVLKRLSWKEVRKRKP